MSLQLHEKDNGRKVARKFLGLARNAFVSLAAWNKKEREEGERTKAYPLERACCSEVSTISRLPPKSVVRSKRESERNSHARKIRAHPVRAFDATRLIAISRSLSLPNKEVVAVLLARSDPSIRTPTRLARFTSLRLNNFATVLRARRDKSREIAN